MATPLTPSYAHMSSACEWESSIRRDSAIGTDTQSRRSIQAPPKETIADETIADDDSVDSIQRREDDVN
jgi:hypothetical protein